MNQEKIFYGSESTESTQCAYLHKILKIKGRADMEN
jgi:hypothetical protein